MFDRSISLRYAQSSPAPSTFSTVLSSSNQRQSKQSDEESSTEKRPLAVLLTWLAAQEKHIEKYRNLYLQRGFDVLTVKTSPWDLLFPKNGARKIAQRCVQSLEKDLPDYPSIILHAFSVGGYQFGEMLIQMQEDENKKTIQDRDSSTSTTATNFDNTGSTGSAKLQPRIKGIVFDSIVSMEGISNGVSRSISSNPVMVKFLKSAIEAHMVVFKNFSTKFYLGASDAVWGNWLRVPALVLAGQNDRIGTADINKKLSETWKGLGIDTTFKCWEKSGHVQHLPRHPVEYQETIDSFLRKIKINTNMITY
ncbi:unnamed protein product [Sphagnum balticum]